MRKTHHEAFDFLSLLDYIDSKPCHDSQVALKYNYGTAVYNSVYSKRYISYDCYTQTWVLTAAGYEYRDRLRNIMVAYCKDHNLV